MFTNYRHQTRSLKANVITVELLFYRFTPHKNTTVCFSKVNYNSTSPLNPEERVRSQVSLSGMCSAQSGMWAGFSSRTLGFPCHYHSTNVPLSLIRLSPTLYNLSKWQRRLITHLKTPHFTDPKNKRHSRLTGSSVSHVFITHCKKTESTSLGVLPMA